MADKKTTEKKAAAEKEPAARKPAEKKASESKPRAAKPAAKAKAKGWGRRPKGSPDTACSVEGCKRPYRAKGYCYFHFKKGRQGERPHSGYRTGSKAGGRAKPVRHGLCEKHEAETYGKAAPEAAA